MTAVPAVLSNKKRKIKDKSKKIKVEKGFLCASVPLCLCASVVKFQKRINHEYIQAQFRGIIEIENQGSTGENLKHVSRGGAECAERWFFIGFFIGQHRRL